MITHFTIQNGDTELDRASIKGHHKVVELLLGAGANPDVQDKVKTVMYILMVLRASLYSVSTLSILHKYLVLRPFPTVLHTFTTRAAMGPQLLSCQTQSHLSWLVVTHLGTKKSLLRQFGAGRISTLLGYFYTVITL